MVAYGRIIPPWMLALPRLGCINLHGSLLPKYRGAAPIQWAVAMGDAFTGNTTMLLEEGLDTGPILLQQTIEIGPDETAVDLFNRLAKAGAPLMVETLAGLADGNNSCRSRRTTLSLRSHRCSIAKMVAWILPLAPRSSLTNRWRGFQPWPGAFTALDGKKLIVHRMEVSSARHFAGFEPGYLHIESHRLFVACAEETWLELLELQLEGKKRLQAAEFLRGNSLAAGTKLGARSA